MARKIDFTSGLELDPLAELFDQRPPPAFDSLEIPFELPVPHAWPDESLNPKRRKGGRSYHHKHGELQAGAAGPGCRRSKKGGKRHG